MAIDPVPAPISSPQVRIKCQAVVASTDRPAPAAISSSPTQTTRLMPNRSISAAANGAISPYSTRFTLTAADMVLIDQPASCRGTINTPGAALKPAAATSVANATPATTQA